MAKAVDKGMVMEEATYWREVVGSLGSGRRKNKY
jgi:hypothetical protein